MNTKPVSTSPPLQPAFSPPIATLPEENEPEPDQQETKPDQQEQEQEQQETKPNQHKTKPPEDFETMRARFNKVHARLLLKK